MKRNGFTLIELLAVIVILALIALISVPLVLNVIEESKQGAAKESAANYVKQVENVLVASLLDGSKVLTTGIYTVEDGNIQSPMTLDVPMKGDKAREGKICVGEKGAVISYSLKVGNYYITSSDGTNQDITDVLVDVDCKEEVIPTPTYQVYIDGTVVYYNPTTGEKCNESEANSATGTNMYGYWLETSYSGSSNVWHVNRDGRIYYFSASSDYYGVRPVITVLKSTLS